MPKPDAYNTKRCQVWIYVMLFKQQHDKCKEHSIPCNMITPVAHIQARVKQQVVEYASLNSLP
jgi:hypothetical protein